MIKSFWTEIGNSGYSALCAGMVHQTSLYIKPHSVLGVPTKVAFLVFFFVLCEFGFSNNGGF